MRVIITCLVVAVLASCAGTAARDNVLVPAMVMGYPGVAEAANAGIDLDTALNDEDVGMWREQITHLGTLLRDGNRAELTTIDWPGVRKYALAAIASWETEGRYSPGVAESLRERIFQFDLAYRKAIQR